MPPSYKSPASRDTHADAHFTQDAADLIQIINEKERSNFKLGLSLIFLSIVFWLSGLELVNSILKTNDYKKPFLFAYFTGSCFVVYLVPDVKYLFRSPKPSPTHNDLVQLTRSEVLKLSFAIAAIYYFYMVISSSALKFTSASNQTVLGSVASVFTLVCGVYFKMDRFTFTKVICIAISFTGVVLVNFSDSKAAGHDDDNQYIPKNPKLGNSMAVLGAVLYTAYMVTLKLQCGTGNRTTNQRRLFGFVGLFIAVFGPGVLYVAHITGLEPFELPPADSSVLSAMVIGGVLNAISDFLAILAVLLTSPLVTSLSLTSSIPITIFIDYVIVSLHGGSSGSGNKPFLYFLGIVSILVSVILINITSSAETELIEDYIEESLDSAMRQDEILSPVLSPLLSSRPHSQFASPLLSPFSRPKVSNSVSNLNLEGEALINKNHSSHLYIVENAENDDANKFVVYNGGNHKYYIERVDNDS